MPDDQKSVVQRMIDAGESEQNIATVIQNFTPMASHEPDQRTWMDTAVDALPMVGGMVGGLVRGPMGSAAGGMIGSRVKQYANAVRGEEPLPPQGEALKRMAGDAMQQGVADLGGRAISGTLRLVGKGLYRAGALPLLGTTQKYGDLVQKGLDMGVPVTKGGVAKAEAIKQGVQATKQAAISAADQRAMLSTQGLAGDAVSSVAPALELERKAGLGDSTQMMVDRANNLLRANGPGMKPSEAEAVKSTLDNVIGGAVKKVRMREPITPDERMNMALSKAIGTAQESIVPEYKALNRQIMDAEGVRKMLVRRLQGNQGLENALTMAAGPAAIPARVAMLPGVASTAGIAVNRLGRAPEAAYSAPLRAALLAMLQQQPDQTEGR
jgi:hypothetical protein